MEDDPPEDDEYFDSYKKPSFSAMTTFSLFAFLIVMVIIAGFLLCMFFGYV